MNEGPGVTPPLRVVIFCRVVDNFGDAGVCWRLARQLAVEHGCRVTLLSDRPDVVRRLWSGAAPPRGPHPGSGSASTSASTSQSISSVRDGVLLGPWPADDAAPVDDADVLICTFGCELPRRTRQALAPGATDQPPLWINLEHLSAEAWVESSHGLASVKPADGAREHFYFPGFTRATGGVLRESDLMVRRARFEAPARQQAWLAQFTDGAAAPADQRTLSLFCYPDAPVAGLLAALAADPQPTTLFVTGGIDLQPVHAALGAPRGTVGERPFWTGGALQVRCLPWLSQDDYDTLLWCCDLNFVRGEDSWIRAHWAARPFVWQPYPQPIETRLAKLDAWLDRLRGGCEDSDGTGPLHGTAPTEPITTTAPTAPTAPIEPDLPIETIQPASPIKPIAPGVLASIGALHHAWCGRGSITAAWPAFARDALTVDEPWRSCTRALQAQPDLASRLMVWMRARATRAAA